MSVVRSPPKGSNTYDDSNRNLIATASQNKNTGGSQPDLRHINLSEVSSPQITFRHKRKHLEDNLEVKFDSFQANIMSLLSDMAKSQEENFHKLSKDISSIKDQINEVKVTTDLLVKEQEMLKSELANINTFKIEMERKVESLEIDVKAMQSTAMSSTGLPSQPGDYEHLFSEIHERSQREKNIIISGIVELQSSNIDDRRKHDKTEICNIINKIVPEAIQPIKTIRLGKHNPNKSRPIKAIFERAQDAKLILRNKSIIKSGTCKIYSDETPNQKKYRLRLTDELNRRIQNGEQNLTIKYINGIPRIIATQSKN